MRVALPLFGNRVAPRCLYAKSMIVAYIENGEISSKKMEVASGLSHEDWVELLLELGVEVMVCGAAPMRFKEEAASRGIDVITNVAGEADDILRQMTRGKLTPGYGLYFEMEKTTSDDRESLGGIDCIKCVDRVCLKGGKCVSGLDIIKTPPFDRDIRKTIDVAIDVASEKDPKLCRVAELVHFAIGMDYKHIGVAFCSEMFREAEILVAVLRRFFKVSPLCCRVGGTNADDDTHLEMHQDWGCNVSAQAELLNRRGTDLNVMAGLCIGCDTIFTRLSKAPVTTLFVKDKMLANNPVGALYSKYYLDDLAHEEP